MRQFRPQRGSYEESMNEAVYVNPLTQDTLTWVLAVFQLSAKTEDITLRPYAYDERNKWDTHVVLVNGQAVGFTDGPFDTEISLLYYVRPVSGPWTGAGRPTKTD